MISQNCPKCGSDRIRRGYRPTPLWSKIIFRYNLLCDNCNWEFTGFAVPGTVSAKPTRKTRKQTLLVNAVEEDSAEAALTSIETGEVKIIDGVEPHGFEKIAAAEDFQNTVETTQDGSVEEDLNGSKTSSKNSIGKYASKEKKSKDEPAGESAKKVRKQKAKKRIKLNL